MTYRNNRCLFRDTCKTYKFVVGRTQNFWRLKLVVYNVSLRLQKVQDHHRISRMSGENQRGTIFQKSELKPKIVDTITVTASKFHTEAPQIWGVTAPNSVTRSTPKFVHFWEKPTKPRDVIYLISLCDHLKFGTNVYCLQLPNFYSSLHMVPRTCSF